MNRALNVTQLDSTEDSSISAPQQNPDVKQVINGGFKIHEGAPE